jgi:hypothetical protein
MCAVHSVAVPPGTHDYRMLPTLTTRLSPWVREPSCPLTSTQVRMGCGCPKHELLCSCVLVGIVAGILPAHCCVRIDVALLADRKWIWAGIGYNIGIYVSTQICLMFQHLCLYEHQLSQQATLSMSDSTAVAAGGPSHSDLCNVCLIRHHTCLLMHYAPLHAGHLHHRLHLCPVAATAPGPPCISEWNAADMSKDGMVPYLHG